jgi:hypothetical protein
VCFSLSLSLSLSFWGGEGGREGTNSWNAGLCTRTTASVLTKNQEEREISIQSKIKDLAKCFFTSPSFLFNYLFLIFSSPHLAGGACRLHLGEVAFYHEPSLVATKSATSVLLLPQIEEPLVLKCSKPGGKKRGKKEKEKGWEREIGHCKGMKNSAMTIQCFF